MNGPDTGGARDTPAFAEPPTAPESSRFAVPAWVADLGRWSWVLIGIAVVFLGLLVLAAATRVLVLSALFAVLVAGTFLPLVDWLARHHFRRSLAALVVVALMILVAILIGLVVVYGIVNQVPQIEQTLEEAQKSIKSALSSTSIPESTADSVRSALQDLLKSAASGAAGALVNAVSAIGSLIFGIFISINIGVWLLIQGRQIGAWASRHVPPVPADVAYGIFARSARFFRGYIWGSTIIGLFNGVVLFVGALVIGVPLAATIGIVAWITNYIPYFGAIMSGAFAVLIAIGAGGPSKAIPMLIVVIIANGFLQTLVSQFALGSALNLHPLAVLFATTAGGLVAGAVGGVFAAPFLKIGLDAYGALRLAGLFGEPEPAAATIQGSEVGPAGTGDTGPPDSGPPDASLVEGPARS